MRGIDKKPEDYKYKAGDMLTCRAACYYTGIEVDENGDTIGVDLMFHDCNGAYHIVIVLACVDDMCYVLHPTYGPNWVFDVDLGMRE